VSDTHERDTSHCDLLRAFQDDDVLDQMEREADALGYRTHEFGDSVWLAHSNSRPTEQEVPSEMMVVSA
jgi:S-adenosylmethionine:tRNA ribosyltransferase-isomerase